MSDYQLTRDVAGKITTRFDKMLRRLRDDYEDEITVVSLMKYYDLSLDDDDPTILEAIERVLEDYMCTADYSAWLLTRKG
jgi:hypothetical protein